MWVNTTVVLLLLLLMPASPLIKNGVMFKHLGKVDFVTSCHNLVIGFNVENNFINPINSLINILTRTSNIVENDSEDYHLKNSYLYELRTKINTLSQIKTTFEKFVETFPDIPYHHTIPSETTDGFIGLPTDEEVQRILNIVTATTINNNNIIDFLDEQCQRICRTTKLLETCKLFKIMNK